MDEGCAGYGNATCSRFFAIRSEKRMTVSEGGKKASDFFPTSKGPGTKKAIFLTGWRRMFEKEERMLLRTFSYIETALQAPQFEIRGTLGPVEIIHITGNDIVYVPGRLYPSRHSGR